MYSFLILFTAAAVMIPMSAQAQDRDDQGYAPQQNEQAIRACRQAVRQQAADRFGTRSVQFRDAHMDPDGNAVIGMIDIPQQDSEGRFRFACSLDSDQNEVRSVRIDPMNEGGGSGYRERSSEGRDRAMDNCRNAVSGRIADQGYDGVQINSIYLDQDSQRILGSAQAQRGDDRSRFRFSCTVELRDGDLRSVNVTRR